MKFTLPDREGRKRLGRFLMVGFGTLFLQMLVYWAARRYATETTAFSISWAISTAAHYCANRFWALPSARHDNARQLGEYFFTIGVSYLLNLIAFKLLRAAGVPELEATALAVPPSTIVVFLLLNYRVFAR